MANKQSFTPEEWTKILESTMLAGAFQQPTRVACGVWSKKALRAAQHLPRRNPMPAPANS